MDGAQLRGLSTEENDQLARSTKKMKRTGEAASSPDEEIAMDTGSPKLVHLTPGGPSHTLQGPPPSYRDTLQRNNPNLTFETRDNPIWVDEGNGDTSDDDEPMAEDDPLCPTILLTAAEKKALREPWRNALIIRMFDKGIGYLQLKRCLLYTSPSPRD